jgi:drug/metabolite transporter (DMT)-like permease
MSELPAQTVALYSYIDPIVAILLSAVLLREGFGFQEVIGTVLILGSTVICETPKNMFKKCFLLNKRH